MIFQLILLALLGIFIWRVYEAGFSGAVAGIMSFIVGIFRSIMSWMMGGILP